MAGSFSDIGRAAQDIASHALQATVTHTKGGDLSFIISTDNVQVAEKLCCTAVKLGAIYAGYQLLKPLIDTAIAKVLGGGEREDQEVREMRPGSLHVLLRCFTDERFLEVLADYESGGIKERLQKEFSEVGIKVEGLKVEIENKEEVEKTRVAIHERQEMASCRKTMTDPVVTALTNPDNYLAIPMAAAGFFMESTMSI